MTARYNIPAGDWSAPLPPLLQSASTPRIIRSEFIDHGKAITIDGEQFEDGKIRIMVPGATSDEEIKTLEAGLPEIDSRVERNRRLKEILIAMKGTQA